MATTPNYGFPYQTLADPPDGPNLGEDGFIAVDSEILRVDADIDAVNTAMGDINAVLPYRAIQTLLSTATSVSFTGIPSTLKTIEVTWCSRDDLAGFNADTLYMRVNNDAGGNYRSNYIQVNNASVVGATAVAQIRAAVGITARGGASAGVFGAGKIVISDWSAPHTGGLNWNFQSAILDSAVGTCWHQTGGGAYLGAGPYTRLDFFPDPSATNFVAGTQFKLVGFP